MFKTFLRYYQFLWHYRWSFITFSVFLVGLSVVESIQPIFLKQFVDAIPEGNFQVLVWILLTYIGIRFLRLGFDLGTHFFGDIVMFRSARDARMQVVERIHDLDFSFHSSKSTGSLISTVKRGDGAFGSLFHDLTINVSRILIGFVVILTVLGMTNWLISMMMLLSFILNLFFAFFLIRMNISRREAFNDSEDALSAIIVDNMINYETVKLFVREQWEQERLGNQFKDWMRHLWRYANSFRTIDIVIGTSANIGLFIILLFTLKMTELGNFTTGEFILVMGFVTSFYPRFFEIIFRFRDIAKHYADLSKYLGILDLKTDIIDPVDPRTVNQFAGEIEFRNVTFTYPGAKQTALKRFNLVMRQGQSIALVGPSGGGKSTVVKLLLRFFDVDSGEILVDGVNIKDYRKEDLRSRMGIVPQEPIMFNNSLRFNLSYGLPVDQSGNLKPTQKQKQVDVVLLAAAAQANLAGTIRQLPEGLDTNVGERGIKLSGGQKQRLAIARMILSQPDIILFDEATSALDSKSERLVQEAFKKASKDKTTIVIAHRLSTVVHSDQIVVIEDGRVREKGSHRYLLQKKDSLYKKFWEMQTEFA